MNHKSKSLSQKNTKSCNGFFRNQNQEKAIYSTHRTAKKHIQRLKKKRPYHSYPKQKSKRTYKVGVNSQEPTQYAN